MHAPPESEEAPCRLCKGAGFVYPDLPRGDPGHWRAVPCQCTLEKMAERQTPNPALGKIDPIPQTFATFQTTMANQDAFDKANAFAEGNSPFIWLLIYGAVGCGKTHLCNAVRASTSQRSIDVRLLSIPDLFTSMRLAIKEEQADNILEDLKQVALLILDDFGMNYGTGWEIPRLEELLDYRYRSYMPTMMTTNLNLSDLPARISSRFSDTERSCRVHNSATDYRKKVRKVN